MRLAPLARALLFGAMTLAACGDDKDPATDTSQATETTQTETTQTTETTEATETSEPTETAGETTTDPVTWDEVASIFVDSCAGCHANAPGSGGHVIAAGDLDDSYAASQQNATASHAACAGKKVGECALIRIQDGTMPQGGACASDPPGAQCPTTAEQDLIQQWIDDGQLGPAGL